MSKTLGLVAFSTIDGVEHLLLSTEEEQVYFKKELGGEFLRGDINSTVDPSHIQDKKALKIEF